MEVEARVVRESPTRILVIKEERSVRTVEELVPCHIAFKIAWGPRSG
jgi:hypothetical protein